MGNADQTELVPDSAWAKAMRTLITRWRNDPAGTYQTWFLWDQRLKNFRSIRRGIAEVSEIEAGTFGSAYKGSPLETVVRSIAEQPDLQGCRSRVPL